MPSIIGETSIEDGSDDRRREVVKKIRARFLGGVIQPLEDVDLEEGQEVTVTISERSEAKGMRDALRSTAGGWKDLVDVERLKTDIYADRLISNRPEPRL